MRTNIGWKCKYIWVVVFTCRCYFIPFSLVIHHLVTLPLLLFSCLSSSHSPPIHWKKYLHSHPMLALWEDLTFESLFNPKKKTPENIIALYHIHTRTKKRGDLLVSSGIQYSKHGVTPFGFKVQLHYFLPVLLDISHFLEHLFPYLLWGDKSTFPIGLMSGLN